MIIKVSFDPGGYGLVVKVAIIRFLLVDDQDISGEEFIKNEEKSTDMLAY